MKTYLTNFDISKKTIFILGGNGLIGNEIFKFCLNSNAKVVCIDIKKKKKFPNKKGVFFEKFDVSSLQNVDSFLKKIVNKYGPPTSFINASYPKTKDWSRNSYKHIKLKSYLKNINIHMNSYIWIAKKIADQMIKYKIKNGSIVLLSSIYGILGQDLELYKNTKMAESMSYSAIKGGINNCVRSMASYYGSRNIRVNSIIAGGVLDKQNKIFVKRYKNKTPLSRMAKPEEIALSTLFLISDASSYITGSSMVVDGGYSIL